MRYLHIEFKDAVLWAKNPKTKDFVRTETGYAKRSTVENGNFKEDITVFHISNMLHVMMGQRPVPSFRKVFYDKVDDIFDMANKSFIKINSPKQTFKRKGEEISEYLTETFTTSKPYWNSYQKPNSVQWFKVKKYLDEDYDLFVEKMNTSLGYDVTKKPFMDLQRLGMDNNKLKEVLGWLTQKRKTPLFNFLTKEEFDFSEITKNKNVNDLVISGVDKVSVLDGDILVPFNDEDLDRFVLSTATILDGGFAFIKRIVDENEIEDSELYTAVSELSTEKH